MKMEVIVSKKPNPNGNYTNFTFSVSANKSKKDIVTITCPKDKENEVIKDVIKIFGGY